MLALGLLSLSRFSSRVSCAGRSVGACLQRRFLWVHAEQSVGCDAAWRGVERCSPRCHRQSDQEQWQEVCVHAYSHSTRRMPPANPHARPPAALTSARTHAPTQSGTCAPITEVCTVSAQTTRCKNTCEIECKLVCVCGLASSDACICILFLALYLSTHRMHCLPGSPRSPWPWHWPEALPAEGNRSPHCTALHSNMQLCGSWPV
jgi:hypothetical protein